MLYMDITAPLLVSAVFIFGVPTTLSLLSDCVSCVTPALEHLNKHPVLLTMRGGWVSGFPWPFQGIGLEPQYLSNTMFHQTQHIREKLYSRAICFRKSRCVFQNGAHLPLKFNMVHSAPPLQDPPPLFHYHQHIGWAHAEVLERTADSRTVLDVFPKHPVFGVVFKGHQATLFGTAHLQIWKPGGRERKTVRNQWFTQAINTSKTGTIMRWNETITSAGGHGGQKTDVPQTPHSLHYYIGLAPPPHCLTLL